MSRLTMGGEPTFVSMEDPDGAGVEYGGARNEQTTARSGRSYQRLRASLRRSRPGSFRPGKWYPGEQLPRWVAPIAIGAPTASPLAHMIG